MALMSDYIQWYLDNNEMDEVTRPFANYAGAKRKLMGEASFEFYKRKLEQSFQTSDDMNRFLQTSAEIVGNKNFERALDNAINNLQMPELSNMKVAHVGYYRNLLKSNADEFSKLVGQINNALSSMISILGISDFSALPPDNKNGTSNAQLNQALKIIYKDNPIEKDRIIKLSEFQSLDNKYKGQYGYLLSLIPDFAQLVSVASNGGVATDESLNILAKILTPIQTLIGICNEYQVEIETNKLLDDFSKSLGKNITVSRVGDTGSAEGFSIGTADIAIHVQQGATTGSFSIPDIGLSLKRTGKNVDTMKSTNIRLKSTNIGGLMHELDPDLVTKFYTLYANATPVVKGVQQEKIPNTTMVAAYKYMKSLALVPALVGNFNVDELVSIFVINNKSYTIYDLLAAIAESSDEDVGVIFKKELSSQRTGIIAQHKKYFDATDYEKRQERSNAIRAAINKLSVAVDLRITPALLKRVAK